MDPPPRPDRRADAFAVDEAAGRQLLLLRSVERDHHTATDLAWTAEDSAWARRLAAQTAGADAPVERRVAERARHASQLLRGRDAAVGRWLDSRFPTRAWLWAAVSMGLLAGLVVDQIGPSQRINLMAPPVWLLVAWNLAVMLLMVLRLATPAGANQGLRRRLAALWAPRVPSRTLTGLAAQWTLLAAPLNVARASALLHLAAAALAGGVLAGMYARGLVLDYRVGWQSSFLEADTVHRWLLTLTAPARWATGIELPDVAGIAALRVVPGAAAAGPAAPWLHLFGATLALCVIGPRLLLALQAAGRARHLARHFPLPWQDAWFQQALRQAAGVNARVWVLPHAAAPSAQAALALRALLVQSFGDDLQLHVADAVAHGDEGQSTRCAPPPGTTLVLLLVGMGATPEAEAQGRLLDTLAQAAPEVPRVLLVDQAAFVRRFGGASARRAERLGLWEAFASAQGVKLWCVDLDTPQHAAPAAAGLFDG